MEIYNNNIDEIVDSQIKEFVNPSAPKSFFLFAGAGSGKTRTLINTLQYIKDKYKDSLSKKRQRIAIITYTNAACDEINRRLDFDSLFNVSTIHSFMWELIKPYNNDIKKVLQDMLNSKIYETSQKLTKRYSESNNSKLESYKQRLSTLDGINVFKYNPNGDNKDRESLGHTEVIAIGSLLIKEKKILQQILTLSFPLVFIDECQDTNAQLVDALFDTQKNFNGKFALGLIGDVKQRIYADGKYNLPEIIPEDWSKPEKRLNHRSARRIINLINKIGLKTIDPHQQLSRVDAEEGFARLFIIDTGGETFDKKEKELEVCRMMNAITSDNEWSTPNIKILILEHHMAARRLGFYHLFTTLYSVDKYKMSLLDGSIKELRLFKNAVIPLISACKDDDRFTIANIVKKESPILDKSKFASSENQLELLSKANMAVHSLCELINNENCILYDIVANIKESGLFYLPTDLRSIKDPRTTQDDSDDNIWDKVADVKLDEIVSYFNYITDNTQFGTHQGVKGLEYERVMVIIDDNEARGFMFSYDKLFELKEKTKTDIQNENDGKETAINRTARLFYVICSRAKKSLAIVAYTDKPTMLNEIVLKNEWFSKDEIICLV